MEKPKYLLVTDIPAPWREKVYENVYNVLGEDFHVVYCGRNEKRRLWHFPHGNHRKTFLKAIWFGKNEWERFINPGIFSLLLSKRPKVVIGFSLNPSVIIAFLLGKILNYKTAVFADTWLGRDRGISEIQRLIRKIIYRHLADAYIGASKKTLKMYQHYNNGIKKESLFLSALCADNDHFLEKMKDKHIIKKYDIMFAGRIVDLKNPMFFSEVALKIKTKRRHCSALIIGDGDKKIKDELFKKLKDGGIDFCYPGFVAHSELPEYYSQAKLLLLPTSRDCWGVVINEALISGVPVITTNKTAAAGELVIDGENGHVLRLDSGLWAEKISFLLENEDVLSRFAKNAQKAAERFNFKRAAEGIISAIRYLENGKS